MKVSTTAVHFCTLISGLLGSLSTLAAADPTALSLGAVTVSASRNDTSAQDMPLNATIISREDIEKSPAQTLDQLLRTVPGFNFTGVPAAISDPTGQQTKMRGLGNAKVLVLVDGIPIMDPFYLTTQWYKVSLSNVERVEVVRGGSSSLWGSMAVAGVVNIITRQPNDDSGEITMSTGSQGTTNLALSQNLKASDALSFNLAINQYDTDGYNTVPSKYRWRYPNLRATSATDTNVQLTTYFSPSSDLNGFLRIGEHQQDQSIGYHDGRNLQKSPDIALGVTKTVDNDSDVAVRAWAQKVDFTKYNGSSCYYQGGTGCLTASSTSEKPSSQVVNFFTQYGDQNYREQGASVTYSRSLSGGWDNIQAGVDYRHLSAEDSESFYSTPTNPATPQVLNADAYGQSQETFIGAFVQTKISPMDALDLTFSARYDHWGNSDRVNTLTKASSGITTGGNIPNDSKSAINPSLGIHYDLTNEWSLRGAAYKSFRAPGFNNTTRSYGVGPTTVANPGLKPETMTGWEWGTDYKDDTFSLGATYFIYNIEDMIATYKVSGANAAPQQVLNLCSSSATTPNLNNCGGSASFYTNDQNGKSHGEELVGSWKISGTLLLDANFTHTDTYLTSKASAITTPLNTQLVAVPKNTASIGLTWKATDKISTYAQLFYIGSMYTDVTTTQGVNYSQGSNTIYNLSANYALNDSIDIFTSVLNLFNREYSENAYAVTQPWTQTLSAPRTANLGFRFKY